MPRKTKQTESFMEPVLENDEQLEEEELELLEADEFLHSDDEDDPDERNDPISSPDQPVADQTTVDQAAQAFQVRIKELAFVPASSLQHHPMQWRNHPQDQRVFLKSLIGEVGFATAVVTYRSREAALRMVNGDVSQLGDWSTWPLVLINGHLRTDLMKDHEIPTLITDLTDEEARQLLSQIDPISWLATSNIEKFEALTRELVIKADQSRKFIEQVATAHGVDVELIGARHRTELDEAMTSLLVGMDQEWESLGKTTDEEPEDADAPVALPDHDYCCPKCKETGLFTDPVMKKKSRAMIKKIYQQKK